MPPKTQYARSGDLQIAYQVNGSGPIDLVLAPGTSSHLDMDWEWPARRRFLERLGEFCRLIRFDKRGTGMSDRPPGVPTLEQRIDDIRAVMDASGSENAAIFGVSEGGSMACLFAATYPERTRALLVWGCQARWIRTDDYPWGMTREQHEQAVSALQENGVTREYLLGGGAGLGPNADPAYVDWFLRYAQAGASPGAVAALERMNADIDTRDILPFIRVPTLVMNRDGDPAADVEAARDLATRIPGATFVRFPGDSHSMFTVEPDRVLEEIQAFVTGARPVQVGDRMLATILCSDIVGSTERATRYGDASWRDLLVRFQDLSARELAAHGGVLVDTAGDGMLATFDGPGRAVRCARAISNVGSSLALQIRAGVHTGEVERDGSRVSGLAVHVAARLCALASADEVLVTSTVKDLVAGSGMTFQDFGIHELKGVPEPRHLFLAQQ